MSLFNKIEVKPEMESFIAKGEGVGIVKVDNYGKASARIESHKVILESYKNEYPIIESIVAITLLSYDPGNFFQEPKLVIGVGQKEYTLSGVDDNDEELEAFYKSVLKLKKQENNQIATSNITETSKIQDKHDTDIDELDELEEELDTKKSKKDTTSKIKGFLSKRFESDEKESKRVPKESIKNEDSNKNNELLNKTEETDDLELILDDELDDDDDEEIIFIEDEKEEKKKPEKTKKEEIADIEEYDEFDEFDEIDDFEELDDFELEDEIIIEEDTSESKEEKTDDNLTKKAVQQEVTEVKEVTDAKETQEKPESKEVIKVKEVPEKSIPDKSKQKTKETKKTIENQPIPSQNLITNEDTNLNQEISQVKEQVNEKISNINQEITNQKEAVSMANTFDPVYQIRRYYELKEEGIITEEEFEMKKKQLLEL